ASAFFFVLAALCMNRVVPLSCFSEDGDLHILQQTGVFILEIGGLRGFHRENLLISVHLGKSEAVRATRYILRRRRRRFLLLPVSDPLAFEIHAYFRLASRNAANADQRAYFAASLLFMPSVKQNFDGVYRRGNIRF